MKSRQKGFKSQPRPGRFNKKKEDKLIKTYENLKLVNEDSAIVINQSPTC